MSSTFEDHDIAAITLLISPERLASLTALTGSARLAIELHQETLDVSAGLMKVIATVELALRNTLCENLTAFFGAPSWLTHPPAPFQWKPRENKNAQKALESGRRAEYSKLTQAGKAALDLLAFPNGRPPNLKHLKRAQLRHRQISVTDGKVIAEITFYFWKRLYSPDYEQTLWRTTLKKTFPNKKLKRADVAEKLEHIYQARNRLAHHEPVLNRRFSGTVDAIEFVARNLGAASPSDNTPLSKLLKPDLDAVKERAKALHDRLASFRTP